MARRLNQEAAKAVKYGGLSEEEALKLVTLNPAKMLRIDDVLHDVFGLRWNVWLSIALFVLAAAWLVRSARRNPGIPEDVRRPGARVEASGSGTAGESPGAGTVEAAEAAVAEESDEVDVTDDTSGESGR
jgi:hypothetical protein